MEAFQEPFKEPTKTHTSCHWPHARKMQHVLWDFPFSERGFWGFKAQSQFGWLRFQGGGIMAGSGFRARVLGWRDESRRCPAHLL